MKIENIYLWIYTLLTSDSTKIDYQQGVIPRDLKIYSKRDLLQIYGCSYVECREAWHGHCMETVIHFSSSFVNSFQILTKYSKKHQQIQILHYKLDSKLAFNWFKICGYDERYFKRFLIGQFC